MSDEPTPQQPAPSTGADLLASLGTGLLLVSVVTAPFLLFTWLGGVSFSTPHKGRWLLLLIIPLLLLYMLKTRRPRRTVGSLLFWRPIAIEQQANHPFKRLRRNLILLLLLLGLTAMAYGLARPVVQGDAREGRSLVLILDVSASMSAGDAGGTTRFEAARTQALELVAAMGALDQASVIAADKAAWTVVPWTSDDGELAAGIRSLQTRHTATALADALILAASSGRAAAGQPEVHLFSDGGGPPPPPVDLNAPLIYHPVGTTGDNLGIVAIDLQPRQRAKDKALAGSASDLAYEVFVSVRNAGPQPREVFVGLERDDRVLAARRVSLPGESDRPVVLEARLSPGPIRVRLQPTHSGRALDVLEVDDSAYALVPEEGGASVVLVTPRPSPALERALLAAGANLRRVDPAQFHEEERVRLYVFEGTLPRSLPPRDCLLIDPPGPVGPIRPGAVLDAPRVAAADREDPLMRFVDLRDVELIKARPLELGGGARVLLQGEDAQAGSFVLMAAWREGTARRIALGFDIYQSTWPLRASFPIFVRNCIQAATEQDRLAQSGLAAGSPLAIPVGSGVPAVEVRAPDGRRLQVAARDGYAYFSDTAWTGVYTVQGPRTQERFCVNLGDAGESRIAPRRTFELAGKQAQAQADLRRPYEVAKWFALVALLVLTLELWAYHQRWA